MLQNKYFWAGVSIASMWIAVLFVGVFGPTMNAGGSTGVQGLPVAVIMVAFFALIGTIVAAVFGFRK
jgi:formate-dependent nitrite reductase membrane component NrfD